jgi:DNA-binding MarR family transcriptional regulator
MEEHSSPPDDELCDELLEFASALLQTIRRDIDRTIKAEQDTQEWRDIEELRATNGQIRLLRILFYQKKCTMQDLADYLGVKQPSVTAMVKRLLEKGFVKRERDEQDWRVVWVKPTERALQAVTLYDQQRRASLQRRLVHLSPEELARVSDALPLLRYITYVEVEL